jgi:hypothetical protein
MSGVPTASAGVVCLRPGILADRQLDQALHRLAQELERRPAW